MNANAIVQKNADELATIGLDQATLGILLKNDFTKATDEQRSMVVLALCRAAKIEPALSPFQFIEVGYGESKQLKLYAGLSYYQTVGKAHNVSVSPPQTHWDERTRFYSCRGIASSPGRTTPAYAVLHIPEFYEWFDKKSGERKKKKIEGQELANLFMKAESKYERRAIKTHLGLTGVPEFGDDFTEMDYLADVNPRGKFFELAPKVGIPSTSDPMAREERRKLYCEVLGKEVAGGPDLSDADWQLMVEHAEKLYAENVITVEPSAVTTEPAEASSTQAGDAEADAGNCFRILGNVIGLPYDAESADVVHRVFAKVLEIDKLESIGDLDASQWATLAQWLKRVEAKDGRQVPQDFIDEIARRKATGRADAGESPNPVPDDDYDPFGDEAAKARTEEHVRGLTNPVNDL